MGHFYLTWKELEAFTNKSGYTLDGWQSEQIIMMSRDYCNFLHKAKDTHCPAPYQEYFDDVDPMDEIRKRVDDSWPAMLRFFNAK